MRLPIPENRSQGISGRHRERCDHDRRGQTDVRFLVLRRGDQPPDVTRIAFQSGSVVDGERDPAQVLEQRKSLSGGSPFLFRRVIAARGILAVSGLFGDTESLDRGELPTRRTPGKGFRHRPPSFVARCRSLGHEGTFAVRPEAPVTKGIDNFRLGAAREAMDEDLTCDFTNA